ncbi:hypothetical protein Ancab_021869 [Ancistrocladus abbreviatus]
MLVDGSVLVIRLMHCLLLLLVSFWCPDIWILWTLTVHVFFSRQFCFDIYDHLFDDLDHSQLILEEAEGRRLEAVEEWAIMKGQPEVSSSDGIVYVEECTCVDLCSQRPR